MQRYRGFAVWKLPAALIFLGIIAAVLFPVFKRAQQNAKKVSCGSNLKQLALGYMQYLQDYDNYGPPVGKAGLRNTSWAQDLYPYVKTHFIFRCVDLERSPEDKDLTSTHAIDYYYNANLASKRISKLKSQETTLLFGEGETASGNYACRSLDSCTGLNDHGLVGAVPQTARTRHLEGVWYAFADGHVKWLRPKDVKNQPGRNVRIHFALQEKQ